MKILICGSREFSDEHLLSTVLSGYAVGPGDVVIHGAARGADVMGGRIARRRGAEVVEFPADWKRYGKSAGYRRNEQMLDQAPEIVLAFFAGEFTAGTMHTVRLAQKRGIEVGVWGGPQGEPEPTVEPHDACDCPDCDLWREQREEWLERKERQS